IAFIGFLRSRKTETPKVEARPLATSEEKTERLLVAPHSPRVSHELLEQEESKPTRRQAPFSPLKEYRDPVTGVKAKAVTSGGAIAKLESKQGRKVTSVTKQP